ncbi:MAG: TlpA family protein disulfide reductase [Anaerolineaceae bacterium]
MIKRTVITLVSAMILISACSPVIPKTGEMIEKPTTEMMAETADSMMEKPTAMMESTSDEMMAEATEPMMEKPTAMMEATSDEMMTEKTPESMEAETSDMMAKPAWFGAELTNVQSGEKFKISDFKGKVVIVENIAMWCTECKKQQEEVKSLLESLGMNENLVMIGLDIDKNEVAEDLKAYATKNGYKWIFSISPEAVSNEFADLYGEQFLNPTSTPILVIDSKGEVHITPFGIKKSDDLKNIIEPLLAEAM